MDDLILSDARYRVMERLSLWEVALAFIQSVMDALAVTGNITMWHH